MTLGEMKKRCLQLAFRYSRKGEVVEDGDPEKKDYLLMLPALIDAAQKELAASAGRLRAEATVSHFPPENLLDTRGGERFPVYTYDGEDLVFSARGAHACTFAVDGNVDVTFEERRRVGAELLVSKIGELHARPAQGFETFGMALAPADPQSTVAARFRGENAFCLQQLAMYAEAFEEARIPPYRPYSVYQLPEDCLCLEPDGVWVQGRPLCESSAAAGFLPGNGCVYIARDAPGAYRIGYYRFPKTVDDETPDDALLEVDADLQAAIACYAAGQLLKEDDRVLSAQYLNEYELRKVNAADRDCPQPYLRFSAGTGW